MQPETCRLRAGCVPVWGFTTDDFRNREDCLPIRREIKAHPTDWSNDSSGSATLFEISNFLSSVMDTYSVHNLRGRPREVIS